MTLGVELTSLYSPQPPLSKLQNHPHPTPPWSPTGDSLPSLEDRTGPGGSSYHTGQDSKRPSLVTSLGANPTCCLGTGPLCVGTPAPVAPPSADPLRPPSLPITSLLCSLLHREGTRLQGQQGQDANPQSPCRALGEALAPPAQGPTRD